MIFRIRITGFIEVDINSFKIAVDYVGIKRKSIMTFGVSFACMYLYKVYDKRKDFQHESSSHIVVRIEDLCKE